MSELTCRSNWRDFVASEETNCCFSVSLSQPHDFTAYICIRHYDVTSGRPITNQAVAQVGVQCLPIIILFSTVCLTVSTCFLFSVCPAECLQKNVSCTFTKTLTKITLLCQNVHSILLFSVGSSDLSTDICCSYSTLQSSWWRMQTEEEGKQWIV